MNGQPAPGPAIRADRRYSRRRWHARPSLPAEPSNGTSTLARQHPGPRAAAPPEDCCDPGRWQRAYDLWTRHRRLSAHLCSCLRPTPCPVADAASRAMTTARTTTTTRTTTPRDPRPTPQPLDTPAGRSAHP